MPEPVETELHPLDGSRAKVLRAIQQARRLSEECEAFANSCPVRLQCRWDGAAHIVYVEGQLPPLYLGLGLGEVVHDLRSGLDLLAWQLALSHVGADVLSDYRIGKRITFPITSSAELFRSHQAIQYFSAEATELVEDHQPYHGGSGLLHPLALLQDWSNADKHRVLTVALARISARDLALQADVDIDVNSITPLAEDSTLIDPNRGIMRIPAPETAHIEFLPIAPPVCFPTFVTDPAQVIEPAGIETLCRELASCVDSFAPLFPAVDWTTRRHEWLTPDLPGT